MKGLPLLFLLASCANLTTAGSKVRFIESMGSPVEIQKLVDKMVAQNDCRFMGFINTNTALFPGPYSVHENEIHSALRNRAAKMGANLVIANFYRKPAHGAGLVCPETFLQAQSNF
jgi:hypothetical protein